MMSGMSRIDAKAMIYGNATHPELFGKAYFMELSSQGVIVTVEVIGLPKERGFLGMHIHQVGDCESPFDKTGQHYNPTGEEHPLHAGDLPALLNSNGYAYISFFDDRFSVKEIIGKSIIIHSQRDDFKTQPSGDSGEKIGCGVINI